LTRLNPTVPDVTLYFYSENIKFGANDYLSTMTVWCGWRLVNLDYQLLLSMRVRRHLLLNNNSGLLVTGDQRGTTLAL